MKIYYLIFLITLFIQFIPAKNDGEYIRRIIFTFIPMFLFGALRVDFGNDYSTYETEFHLAHQYSHLSFSSEHLEHGYIILEKIIPTWRLFLIFTSAITCIAYGIVFYKCIPPKYSWVAVGLLFLAGDKTIFFQYSGIRNAIVIAIMYLSLALIKERKWMPITLLSLFAMTFHTSAIFMIPLVYLLCSSKHMTNREGWMWIIAMLIIQFVNLDSILVYLTPIVNNYFERYSDYTEFAEEMGDNRSLLIRGFCAVFISLIVWFMRSENLSENENVVCRMALLFIFGFLLGSMNFRIPQYLGYAFVCASVIVMTKWRNIRIRNVYFAITFLFLFYSFFIVWMNRVEFPYHNYHSIIG